MTTLPRKELVEQPRDRSVSVRLTRAEDASLNRISDYWGVSAADAIRQLIGEEDARIEELKNPPKTKANT